MTSPETQIKKSKESKEEQIKEAIKETQEFLYANEIPCAFSNGSILIIGEYQPLDPNGALALLPYCSRNPECPIRKSDKTKSTELLTTTDGCQLCNIRCDVGEIFKLKGQQIAEVRVIGSSHDIENPIDEFQRTRKLTHIVAVCCVSSLVKYLQKVMDAYKNVTVIYTPVVGSEICQSLIDSESRRKDDSFPNTFFDSDSLIKFLIAESKDSVDPLMSC